ncbi:hypothetical protein [Streptomyces violaceorubidus]|uniref:Lonely Cys domain-containing protein n=1 Tax=Streptomyces violaceorubidus TaxID=284042 RepID=A0ABV1T275_9ACTN
MGTRNGGEYWAAALPLATPESERAGSLFSEPEGAGSPMTVGFSGEPMAVDSPEGHGAADRAESPALALPGAAPGAAPALSGAGSQQPSEVVEITDPLERSLLGLGPWAQYPWHGQPSDRSFGFGRAGIHNLDAGQERTLFEALRAEYDTDLTVGDVLRRVHRILQDARPGRRIAVHPDDVIALHQRYHRPTPDVPRQARQRTNPHARPAPQQARQRREPRTMPASQAFVPPEAWLDGVAGDERRLALAVGEYVAVHRSAEGIVARGREVELPSGHVRKLGHWVRAVRGGTVSLHRATVRYLEVMSFFSAKQLARAQEKSGEAPSTATPREHLLDGVPKDERTLAFALKDYVTNVGSIADVTGWDHEVKLSNGRKRVSSWLESVRMGHTTIAGKTADYLKDLSLLNEAHLANLKKLPLPSADRLDGAPAHERAAALLSTEYIVQHRGDQGLFRAQQPLDFPDGVSWNLGAWVEAVRGGQLAISRETFQYLERLPSFFRPGAAANVRIAEASSAAVAGTSSQGDLARSARSSVPPGAAVPLDDGTVSGPTPGASSSDPASPAGAEAPLTGSAALRILEPEDEQEGAVRLVREADGPAALILSADMTLAVGVDGTFQSAYATAEAIEQSNAALAAAGSGVRLRRDENHHTDVPSAEASGPVGSPAPSDTSPPDRSARNADADARQVSRTSAAQPARTVVARDAARFEGKGRAVPPADAVADPADPAEAEAVREELAAARADFAEAADALAREQRRQLAGATSTSTASGRSADAHGRVEQASRRLTGAENAWRTVLPGTPLPRTEDIEATDGRLPGAARGSLPLWMRLLAEGGPDAVAAVYTDTPRTADTAPQVTVRDLTVAQQLHEGTAETDAATWRVQAARLDEARSSVETSPVEEAAWPALLDRLRTELMRDSDLVATLRPERDWSAVPVHEAAHRVAALRAASTAAATPTTTTDAVPHASRTRTGEAPTGDSTPSTPSAVPLATTSGRPTAESRRSAPAPTDGGFPSDEGFGPAGSQPVGAPQASSADPTGEGSRSVTTSPVYTGLVSGHGWPPPRVQYTVHGGGTDARGIFHDTPGLDLAVTESRDADGRQSAPRLAARLRAGGHGGDPRLAFSRDGSLAVSMHDQTQVAFATRAAADNAERALRAAGSSIRVVLDDDVFLTLRLDDRERTLYRVRPGSDGEAGAGLSSYKTATEALGGPPGHAVFRDAHGVLVTAPLSQEDGTTSHEAHKLVESLLDLVDQGQYSAHHPDAGWAADVVRAAGEPDESGIPVVLPGSTYDTYQRNLRALPALARNIGVNEAAFARTPGEGYLVQSIAAEGEDADQLGRHAAQADPDHNPNGYHFASVLLVSEDGTATVTLEHAQSDNVLRSAVARALADRDLAAGLAQLRERSASNAPVTTAQRVAEALEELRAAATLPFGSAAVVHRAGVERARRERQAVQALRALAREQGITVPRTGWALRLIGSHADDSFHNMARFLLEIERPFTMVVAGRPAIGPHAPDTGTPLPDRGSFPEDRTAHRAFAPDPFTAHREDVRSLLALAETVEQRETNLAAGPVATSADDFTRRTRLLADRLAEAARKTEDPGAFEDFLRRPTTQLLEGRAARAQWLADIRGRLASVPQGSTRVRRILENEERHLQRQLTRIDTELGHASRWEHHLGPRENGLGTWIADALTAPSSHEALQAARAQVHSSREALERSLDAADGDGAADLDRLSLRYKSALEAVHTLSALTGPDLSGTDPAQRAALVAAEQRSRQLFSHHFHAAGARLRHLDARWGTNYPLQEVAGKMLQHLFQEYLASPAMAVVSNADADALLDALHADPGAALPDLLGRESTGLSAALVSVAHQAAGAAPHSGLAVRWKHAVRQRALHTPEARPDAGLDYGLGISSLHGLLAQGDPEAVRLVVGEATRFRHDIDHSRAHFGNRLYPRAHFGAVVVGELGWNDVAEVTLTYWDDTSRDRAEARADFLLDLAERNGLAIPEPVLRAVPALDYADGAARDITYSRIPGQRAPQGVDLVPKSHRAMGLSPVVDTEVLRHSTYELIGEAPRWQAAPTPWSRFLEPGQRPFLVVARATDDREFLLARQDGTIGKLPEREFADIVGGIVPTTEDGPVVLLISHGGTGDLVLPRRLAARTNRPVWSFSGELDFRTASRDGAVVSRVVTFAPAPGRPAGTWTVSHPEDLGQDMAPDAVITVKGEAVPDALLRTQPISHYQTHRPIGRSAHTRAFLSGGDEEVGQTFFPVHESYTPKWEDPARNYPQAGPAQPLPWAGAEDAGRTYFWDSHATPKEVHIPGPDDRFFPLGPAEHAAYLKRRRSFRGASRVVMVACNAGRTVGRAPAYAQQVADATGLTVFGADGKTTGRFLVGVPESENRIGRWHTFRPGAHATREPTAPVPTTADGSARE